MSDLRGKILQLSFLDLNLQGRTPGLCLHGEFCWCNTIQCWKFYATVMLIKAFLSTKAVAFEVKPCYGKSIFIELGFPRQRVAITTH